MRTASNLGRYSSRADAGASASAPGKREIDDYYNEVKTALLALLDLHKCTVPTTGDLPEITFNVGVLCG